MNAFSLHHHSYTIRTNTSFSSLSLLEKSRKVNKKCKQFQFVRHNIFGQTSLGPHQSHHDFYTNNNNNNNSYNKKKYQIPAQQLLHCQSSSLPTEIRDIRPVTAISKFATKHNKRISSQESSAFRSDRRTNSSFILSFAQFSSFESFVCNIFRSWSCQRVLQARVTSHLQCPFSSG
jgi:hypothetical protein